MEKRRLREGNEEVILFAGGGTLGPVMPLLAVWEAWKQQHPRARGVWIGTPGGPEQAWVKRAGLDWKTLPPARFPRYPSTEWIFLPWRLVVGWAKSVRILRAERPQLVATAGGYTAVPVAFAARLFRIPIWAHQQDFTLSLTNRLLTPIASLITTVWPDSVQDFPVGRAQWVGNPVPSFRTTDRVEAARAFGLDTWINQMMFKIAPRLLTRANVLHLTGKGKMDPVFQTFGSAYVVRECLVGREKEQAWAAADVIVCRAGMGTIADLSAWKKPAVIIPLPDSPQEANARELEKRGAAVVLLQKKTKPDEAVAVVERILSHEEERSIFSARVGRLFPTLEATEKVVKELGKLTLV